MAQNVEEGLRHQAVNRAQRVKKQMHGDFPQVQSSSVASDDGIPAKHLRLIDVSSSAADNSPFSGSQVAGHCLPSEIELVMYPHPQQSKYDVNDSQTRFIKTTPNATGNKLSPKVDP